VGAVNDATKNQNGISTYPSRLTLAETVLLNFSKIQLNEEEMCCISKF
jgi:hypothetical protein